MTRVVRSLTGPREDSIELAVSQEKLDDPTFVTRLSFRPSSKVRRDEADLEAIWGAEDHALFIDANLASPDEGPEIWSGILRGEGRVHITARVLKELIPFFERHGDHPLLKAIKDEDPSLSLDWEPEADAPGVAVRDYYVELLARRRFIAEVEHRAFEEREGRKPTEGELKKMEAWRHREYGERGILLEKKKPSPYFTDEHLVYAAVEHAIRTGQPTLILSGDYDVEEQFYKLVELLTRHYFSMWLADRYLRDPHSFRPRSIPPELLSVGPDAKFMQPNAAAVLDLGGRRLHDLVPSRFRFVPVGCITVNPTYVSRVIYGAEREMFRVIGVKERTRGLATEMLGGRNMHVWGTPPTFPPEYTGEAFICFDRRTALPDGKMEVSALDNIYTLWSKASHATVEPRPSSSLLYLR